LDRVSSILHAAERIQLTVNRLNAAYTLLSAGSAEITVGELLAAARDVTAATAAIHQDHETAITALTSAGSVLVDAYVQSVHDGEANGGLLVEAEELLTSAAERAGRVYPPGHRVPLTAQVNLAAVYGAPAAGGHYDAERSADLLLGVAAEAGSEAAEHAAIAMTNLGTLRVGQGRWAEAAQAYGAARRSRQLMIQQTTARPSRLGEVIATGDLAAREALSCARVGEPDQAVAVLEDSRVNLLRHRHGITPAAEHVQRPGQTMVHLATCSFGTVGVVRQYGRPAQAFIGTMPASTVGSALRALVGAPDRIARIVAFDEMADTLQGLTDTVAELAGDHTEELCVVACGPLSGAPLHAMPGIDGRTWTDRWVVRYWPSATVAAHVGRQLAIRPRHAIAVADRAGDLPLAPAEVDCVRRLAGETSTAPTGWSVAAWLRAVLPGADLAHFACHAKADLVDPTGSRFDFGMGEQLTVADLLDGPDLQHLQLVVASSCQAGTPAPDAPDELLGIGYGLLHAGARAAITTLWEVSDTPAALLVARLYEQLRESHEPAAALRRAQRWLAGVDNAALARLCAESCRQVRDDEVWMPALVARQLGPAVAAAEPATRPFHHPADWGAFSYLGG
jgi:hypothetical protein